MQNYFGVAGGLEDRALALQVAAPLPGVGDIAVVCYCNLPFIAVHQERLSVEQHRVACRGIAGVADGEIARQTGDAFGSEDIRDVAHGLEAADLATVTGGDARALLAAVLQGI